MLLEAVHGFCQAACKASITTTVSRTCRVITTLSFPHIVSFEQCGGSIGCILGIIDGGAWMGGCCVGVRDSRLVVSRVYTICFEIRLEPLILGRSRGHV
jgi:hypothetical protein